MLTDPTGASSLLASMWLGNLDCDKKLLAFRAMTMDQKVSFKTPASLLLALLPLGFTLTMVPSRPVMK